MVRTIFLSRHDVVASYVNLSWLVHKPSHNGEWDKRKKRKRRVFFGKERLQFQHERKIVVAEKFSSIFSMTAGRTLLSLNLEQYSTIAT